MIELIKINCPRCQGTGLRKSGNGGERSCFNCAGTGDVAEGSGHDHPFQFEGYKARAEGRTRADRLNRRQNY